MKKYVIYNNETEMSVEKMFDTACVSCLKDYNDNPKAKRLVVEAMKNKKEIIKVIKNSKTHKIGCETGRPEVHCITFVDGNAVCLKSLSLPINETHGMYDQIQFVYEKKYNKYNYIDFHKDYLSGLDAVWTNFEYEIA